MSTITFLIMTILSSVWLLHWCSNLQFPTEMQSIFSQMPSLMQKCIFRPFVQVSIVIVFHVLLCCMLGILETRYNTVCKYLFSFYNLSLYDFFCYYVILGNTMALKFSWLNLVSYQKKNLPYLLGVISKKKIYQDLCQGDYYCSCIQVI